MHVSHPTRVRELKQCVNLYLMVITGRTPHGCVN